MTVIMFLNYPAGAEVSNQKKDIIKSLDQNDVLPTFYFTLVKNTN